MTRGKGGRFYDDDDLDYDEDYDEDYDDWEEDAPLSRNKQGVSSGSKATSSQGASKLAQALCNPPPLKPNGKPQLGAVPESVTKSLKQPPGGFPLVPPMRSGGTNPVAVASCSASLTPPFNFNGPSPDDLVLAAQQGRPIIGTTQQQPSGSGSDHHSQSSSKRQVPGVPFLPQSKFLSQPTPLQGKQSALANSSVTTAVSHKKGTAVADSQPSSTSISGQQHDTHHANHHPHDPEESAERDVVSEGRLLMAHSSTSASSGLLHAASSGLLHAASSAASRVSERPRVSNYRLPPDLLRECDELMATELQQLLVLEEQGSNRHHTTSSATPAASGLISSQLRQGLHLVVLGHVDAGKSTLMGRLLHDVGATSIKDVHKNQREAAQAGKASFAWAWALDERPEERARGVTVDVAMHRFRTPRLNVTLLDAPGHRDFVPNAITGAAQADAALLLVDGSPGGFEAGFGGGGGGDLSGGQTREHAQLARSLGIEQLAVVVSKLDMYGGEDAESKHRRFEEVRSVLLPYLKSCGYKESCLQWLPAVGPSGQNVCSPPTEPTLAAWWKSGLTVLQAIDNFTPRERAVDKPVRLPVSDVTKTRSGAYSLGGKLESGALKPGSRLVLVPSAGGALSSSGASLEVGSVKSLEVDGEAAKLARAGDSVEVVMTGLDLTSVPQGAVLSDADCPSALVTRFEARVIVLEVSVPILKGQQVTLHAHVAREEGNISALISVLNPKSGEVAKAKPRCLLKGQTALIEVTAARSLVLEEYKDIKALGRIALREGGRTIAVGIVTKLLD
ncbi:hypothetical protein CEUSTIGMA_g11087.t1 [Chlamydomonas eustigma]|uniref:Tr-type G domain-containing protein n=1 Tax=Chlamydomonas eustigma TaxID=1157962 RepID=A0A250XL95_9CHLO|nr:hypothetical protein CEUSTIGMA_g11087.t1 [Chlamydomonas eustigma]|eukprot:GAX83662.1 hypothetical protein CEUSTIGMA_g11087.t1 [Chlamydomonas eustigma]